MKKFKILCLALFASIIGCADDPTGPAVGEFTASMSGASTMQLEGNSFATRVFSEAWPEGRYTVSMLHPAQGGNHLILIECPDTNPMQIRTITLGATEQSCRGIYRRISTTGDLVLLDEAISHEGTLTITGMGATAIVGTFAFTGPLRTGTQEKGAVTLSGSFVSTRQ
jgi:hypothetical protein